MNWTNITIFKSINIKLGIYVMQERDLKIKYIIHLNENWLEFNANQKKTVEGLYLLFKFGLKI